MTEEIEKEQPIQDDLVQIMNEIGRILKETIHPYGFALLVFPLNTASGRMNYISNADRADMLTALREFIDHNEAQFPEVKPK